MWRSLGVTVVWGLTVSTLITLVLIPTLYCSLTNRTEKRRKKK
jgi:HAE1 family hydrophobic/amphiphilic exporter-1